MRPWLILINLSGLKLRKKRSASWKKRELGWKVGSTRQLPKFCLELGYFDASARLMVSSKSTRPDTVSMVIFRRANSTHLLLLSAGPPFTCFWFWPCPLAVKPVQSISAMHLFHLPREFWATGNQQMCLPWIKSLYGLTIAPYLWHQHLFTALKHLIFKTSSIDPWLLYKINIIFCLLCWWCWNCSIKCQVDWWVD